MSSQRMMRTGMAAIVAMLWGTCSYAAKCDDACLRMQLDQYLSALTKRDARKLTLAPNVRYTENGSSLKVG